MVELGWAVEGVLERVRRAVSPFGVGEEVGSGKREATDEEDEEKEAVSEEPEAAVTEMDGEEREEFDEGDQEGDADGEDGDGDEADGAVRRRRVRAVVLDTGRPAAPST